MRVIVTGSRDWEDASAIWWELNRVAAECRDTRLYIVHGSSGNADIAAHVWAENNPVFDFAPYIVEMTYRATWSVHGKPAGMMRNRRMVDDVLATGESACCLAFINPCAKPDCIYEQPHDSHGTAHCAGYAEERGMPVARRHSATVGD